MAENDRPHFSSPDSDDRALVREPLAALVLTVPEAGALLGIGASLAWKLAAEGVLPTIKFSRRVVVPRVAIDLLLEAALKNWSPADAARRLAHGQRE